MAAPDFWLYWWAWGAAALALVAIEILAPGFIALGFGIGAGIVALLVFLFPQIAASTSLLFLIFASLSLVAWLALRRFFSLHRGQVKTFDTDIND